MSFPCDAQDRKIGNQLIGRKVHDDIWNIVKNNIKSRTWNVLLVLGPAGAGKVI
jgi:hypothetical protein